MTILTVKFSSTGEFDIQHYQPLKNSGETNAEMSYPMHSRPLREDDIDKPNIPPIAGPEIDDLDPADSGIDDGLLPPRRPDGRPGSRRGSRPPSHTPTFPGNGVDYPGEPGHGPVCFMFD